MNLLFFSNESWEILTNFIYALLGSFIRICCSYQTMYILGYENIQLYYSVNQIIDMILQNLWISYNILSSHILIRSPKDQTQPNILSQGGRYKENL